MLRGMIFHACNSHQDGIFSRYLTFFLPFFPVLRKLQGKCLPHHPRSDLFLSFKQCYLEPNSNFLRLLTAWSRQMWPLPRRWLPVEHLIAGACSLPLFSQAPSSTRQLVCSWRLLAAHLTFLTHNVVYFFVITHDKSLCMGQEHPEDISCGSSAPRVLA